jgi:hypothetical protein
MKQCLTALGIVLALSGFISSSGAGQSPDKDIGLKLSLAAATHEYELNEPIQFSIRFDNYGENEKCVPTALGCGHGYVLFITTDPNGDRVEYECEVFDDFHGEAKDLVCLSPGSFYGVREKHGGLWIPGTWRFAVTYYGVSSDRFPNICSENITSNEILLHARE